MAWHIRARAWKLRRGRPAQRLTMCHLSLKIDSYGGRIAKMQGRESWRKCVLICHYSAGCFFFVTVSYVHGFVQKTLSLSLFYIVLTLNHEDGYCCYCHCSHSRAEEIGAQRDMQSTAGLTPDSPLTARPVLNQKANSERLLLLLVPELLLQGETWKRFLIKLSWWFVYVVIPCTCGGTKYVLLWIVKRFIGTEIWQGEYEKKGQQPTAIQEEMQADNRL